VWLSGGLRLSGWLASIIMLRWNVRGAKMEPEELQRIILDIVEDEYASDILEHIAFGIRRRSDIAAGMGVHEQTISRGVKLLKKHRLIYSTPHGYRLTPRGVQVAKAMFFEDSQLYDMKMALDGEKEGTRHD